MRLSLLLVLLIVSGSHGEPPPLISTTTSVIAHRGGTGPDGTLAGIKKSLDQGYLFIELDVRLSKDGRAVIMHDPTVDRTTNGKGKVADMTFDELRTLDAGAKYKDVDDPKKSYAGQRIPTPEEVLELVGGRGIVLLELKVPEAAEAVVKAVVKSKAKNRAVVRTADYEILRAIKKLDPEVLTGSMGAIPENSPDALIAKLKEAKVSAFTPKVNTGVTAAVVKKFHEAGIAFWGTNTNDPEEMKQLIEAHAAGIITDLPGVLQKLLKP
ncbi:glycerophosphodiester phosphodiesterase [Zavarzinella formosa]|uniref:glycerophosphodiester phosphodiesterase n=1 Tax=Zavarzinella formosa TaxID=360055 RepID=UPI0002D9D431|nr:glycerophosphodiester phosphodiesterase family protein [Zavarzinella formosa]